MTNATSRIHRIHRVFVGIGIAIVASGAFAQSQTPNEKYPSRPIRWVAPSSVGGGNDVLARLIGAKMTERWGQQVVVDNRSGAGGIIGSDIVAKSAPDGHTLLIVAGGFAVNPSLYKAIPYDTLKDFASISYVAHAPLVLVAHSSVGVKSVRELVELAKAKPGQLNYATSGVGTTSFLAAELFKYMTGVQMVHVPYKGAGLAAAAAVAGQVDLIATTPNATVPHVRTGRIRALGVTSATRLGIIPEVPTVAEQGLAGYEVVTAYWVLVPAKTPTRIINALHEVIVRIVNLPETQKQLEFLGFTPVGSTPDELTAILRSDMAKWSKILREIGVRPE